MGYNSIADNTGLCSFV